MSCQIPVISAQAAERHSLRFETCAKETPEDCTSSKGWINLSDKCKLSSGTKVGDKNPVGPAVIVYIFFTDHFCFHTNTISVLTQCYTEHNETVSQLNVQVFFLLKHLYSKIYIKINHLHRVKSFCSFHCLQTRNCIYPNCCPPRRVHLFFCTHG